MDKLKISFFLLYTLFFYSSHAQNIELIPRPISHTVSGQPFVFEDVLYVRMYDIESDNFDLFKFTENDGFSEVVSPEGYDDGKRGFVEVAFVFNGKLYLTFENNDFDDKLLLLDNGNLIEIENDEFLGGSYEASPIIFNDEIYFNYTKTFQTTLAKLDGNEIISLDTEYKMIEPFVFDDKLYFVTFVSEDKHGLVSFDGVNYSIKENFEFGDVYQSEPQYFPIVDGNYVYLRLAINDENDTRLFRYDGNTLEQITSSNNLSDTNISYLGPFEDNNEIYYRGMSGELFRYTTTTSEFKEITYDGNLGVDGGYFGGAFVYGSELHFQFKVSSSSTLPYLAKINSQDEIELLFEAYADESIVFSDKLYFKRYLNNGDLISYDGSVFSTIDEEFVYEGYPVIFNEKVYLTFKQDDRKTLGRLNIADDVPLSLNAEGNFAIYPNPATNQIIVKSENTIPIFIANSYGQVFVKGLSNTKINIGDLESGVYFVHGMGIKTKKLIKK